MASRFGGIEVLDESVQSKFGGIPVSEDLEVGGFVPTPEEAKNMAAQNLVAKNRAAGLTDLLTRQEAETLAAQAGIPAGGLGEGRVFSTNQFAPGLAGDFLKALTGVRQAASGVSLGTAGALGKLIEDSVLNKAQQQILGSQEMRKRAPAESELGTLIGSAAPTRLVGGAALSPGAPLLQKIIQGAKVGAPVGIAGGASQVLEEKGQDAAALDVLNQALIGGGVGLGVGGALPIAGNVLSKSIEGSIKGGKAIGSPVKTLENAGIIRTPESIAVDILNPAGQGELRQVAQGVESGKIIEGFQTIKNAGKFNDFDTLISSGKKAVNQLGSEIKSFIKNNPGITIDGSDGAKAMLDQVARDPILLERNPEVIDLIKKNAAAFDKTIPLQEVFDRLNSINKRHENYFTSTAKGQNTKLQDAEFATDEVMRKYLSSKADVAFAFMNSDQRNPFREYGNVNNILHESSKRYSNALVARLKEVSNKGVVADFVKNFDITKPLSSLIRPAEFLRGGELGRLNRRINSLNEKLPEINP